MALKEQTKEDWRNERIDRILSFMGEVCLIICLAGAIIIWLGGFIIAVLPAQPPISAILAFIGVIVSGIVWVVAWDEASTYFNVNMRE